MRSFRPYLLILLAGSCGPKGEVKPRSAETYQRELEEARAEQNLPGLAMAVAFRAPQDLWASADGFADLETQDAWTASHRSRIGSVTKTFTSALVLQLVDEGVVSLDDPIERWVPGWFEGPTLAHLLGNTSGIASYNYIGSFDSSRSWTPEALVQWAYDLEPALRFTPGTQWEYSNTNFVLLGLVYEAATGESYGEGLVRRFFEPLELSDTSLALGFENDPRLVRSYSGEPPVDVSRADDPSMGWAAGAIVSTPADLARWLVALYGGELHSPETFAKMTTPSAASIAAKSDYGLGTFYESDGELTIFGHTGGIAGYATYAYYLEDPGVALVLMANLQPTDLRAASSYGWAAILGIEHP